nr:hypothetical protein [uncultured Mediterranean phage uvMED]
MADCGDVNERLEAKLEELRHLDEMLVKLDAANEKAATKRGKETKTIKTYTGDEITTNTSDWAARAELEAVEMGEERIIDLVTDGFKTGRKPAGETGRMVAYRQLDPSKPNIAALLEVMGLRRANTPKGIELKRPFTQQAASKALMRLASETGMNPRDLAENLGKKFKNIDNLPASVYGVAKARWETSTEFADTLETVADAMQKGAMTPDLRVELGNSARWAHYFEQMDAAVRRKVGQSLKSLQFKADEGVGIDLIDLDKDITELTFEEISEGSLLAQVIEHVDNGDHMKLRKIAKAKRVLAVTDAPINQPNFLTELQVLNQYRKNNLFSSVASFGVRNLSSGWVAAHLTAEDIVGGAMRVGPLNEWHAASYAAGKLTEGMAVAFRNSWDSFTTGKSRMAVNNLRDIDPKVLAENKLFVENTLKNSWNNLFELNLSPTDRGLVLSHAISFFNVLNGSVNYLIGKLVEETTGSSAGYMAAFRALNGGDELIRTMAWNWYTGHEAFLQALEKFGDAIDPDTGRKLTMKQIEEIANRETNRLLFTGYMTDDDLAKFRRERNATLGMPVGKEIDNDELRLQIFNNLNGVPNLAEDLAKKGVKRMEDVTFTGKLPSALAGVQMLRANPLGGWLIPVFRSNFHGISYILSRTPLIAGVDALIKQVRKKKGTVTQADVIDARAKVFVASMVTLMAYTLWQRNAFTDGGPPRSRPVERERWMAINQPYAFNFGYGSVPTSRMQSSVESIDFFDLIGLNADVFRLIDEGHRGEDVDFMLGRLRDTIANQLNAKAGLKGLMSFMNAATEPNRYDMTWAMQRQMSGIMPYTGLAGNFARAGRTPGQYPDQRRFLSPEDAKRIGESDPTAKAAALWFGDAMLGNYPFYDELTQRPYKTEWTGAKKLRPKGLPFDAAIPYTPLMMSQNRGVRWFAKHGFVSKPRANNVIAGAELAKIRGLKGEAAKQSARMPLTMTNDEETVYRTAFYSTKGPVKAESFGLDPSINKFVYGKTFLEAATAMSEDEALNAKLANPLESPSVQVNPTKSLPKRLSLSAYSHAKVYEPLEDVQAYYDRLGLYALYTSKEVPTMRRRYQARLRERAQQQIDINNSNAPQGLTRD